MYKILIAIFLIVTSLCVTQGLLQLESKNEVEADIIDWSHHPCNRPCPNYGTPKTCYYRFVVENYLTMSKACYNCPRNVSDCFRPHCLPGDGINKRVFIVNRQLPGPHIQVCLGDTIVVDVKNAMPTTSTTIHWHGLRQIKTPYMDGVPYVTQCPIFGTNMFRYQFIPEESGTFIWHAHAAEQRVDGVFGPLTIRVPPKLNPHRKLYDFDKHNMMVANWHTLVSEDEAYTILTQTGRQPGIETILINGFGRYKNFAESDDEPIFIPSAVFEVKQRNRYRFRIINAGVDSAIQISIDEHTMLVISTDANDIVPVEVDSIYMWPGERYDVIINADQEIDNYWIRYHLRRPSDNTKVDPNAPDFQVAILRYESAPKEDPTTPPDWDVNQSLQELRVLNSPIPCQESQGQLPIPITSLRTLDSNDASTEKDPDYQLHLGFNTNPIDEHEYHRKNLYGFNQVKAAKIYPPLGTLQFNHIRVAMPPIPLLPERDMITPDMLCNATTITDKDCEREPCTCPHTLHLNLNSVVELIIVDESDEIRNHHAMHAMHLHGYFFRVVATGQLKDGATVQKVKKLDRMGLIKRTLDRAPIKDTIMVPIGGYTIIRFIADNPGYWFFHCHVNPHIPLGMGVIFKVGEHEDMVPVPPNFPKCSKNYAPRIM